MTERIPVIIGAARTPTGKFLGNLAGFSAPQLGAVAIKEAVRRSGLAPEAIDEVIMGNVVSAGIGQAPARQAARLQEHLERADHLLLGQEITAALPQRHVPG